MSDDNQDPFLHDPQLFERMIEKEAMWKTDIPAWACTEDRRVWAAAVAIAEHRHPNAIYPQPKDVLYARAAVEALDMLLAADLLRQTGPTSG